MKQEKIKKGEETPIEEQRGSKEKNTRRQGE